MKALRILTPILLLFSFLLSSEAALRVEVDYKGEYYQVIDAKRALPVIGVKGKSEAFHDPKFG